MGVAIGLASYTFIYAKGWSYMGNNPEACANCHVMSDQYAGWLKSSHRAVATCNDCHTPPGLVAKYYTKASNGFWHSWAFTTGRFPEPIRIGEGNLAATEQACRKCHVEVVEAIEARGSQQPTRCVRCHDSVGHLH
jgi:cytochrome c nitrite reductase small subunit